MIKLYKKRIVHINVNIIIASLLSIFIAAYPVMYVSKLMISMKLIAITAFLIDSLIDFVLFGLLHFFAFTFFNNGNKSMFLKDVLTIQNHRIFLSVIYAIIAIIGHYIFMVYGFTPVNAFIISYTIALIVTRIIHTIYGLKTGLFD